MSCLTLELSGGGAVRLDDGLDLDSTSGDCNGCHYEPDEYKSQPTLDL